MSHSHANAVASVMHPPTQETWLPGELLQAQWHNASDSPLIMPRAEIGTSLTNLEVVGVSPLWCEGSCISKGQVPNLVQTHQHHASRLPSRAVRPIRATCTSQVLGPSRS